MYTAPHQQMLVILAAMFVPTASAGAGLIEYIDYRTNGALTLSIEDNALRLTDHTDGQELLRIYDIPGVSDTPATQLGIAGEWNTSNILTVPLASEHLLPSTRLDSLFDGRGLDTGGNILRELVIFDRSGRAYAFDLDEVETIGGNVPEPAIAMMAGMGAFGLLIRRTR